ncbi:hypothetical protein BJV82DRAFT_29850 [Fennellomyces sp. T-0311]|nr:hypothetical protein BJV82DRAFT_29850 [Fennellomyces sp. T-0311]
MNKRRQIEPVDEPRGAKRQAYSHTLHGHTMKLSHRPESCSNDNGISSDAEIGASDTPNERQAAIDDSNQQGFIGRLPSDIVGDILSRLTFKERHQCMAVCKTWKMYLSTWEGMWREVDICLEEGASDGWLQWIPQPDTGHKIRQLRFFGNSVQMKKAFDALKQRNHKHIQSLVIGSFYAWDTVDISAAEQVSSFFGLLDLTGPKLVNLEFRHAYFPANTVMDKIFPLCKQLRRLICEMEHDSENPPHDWSPAGEDPLPCLTEFLWSTEIPLALDKLLPRCTSLHTLTIESAEFGDARILQRLDELCPTLQQFYCTDAESIGNLEHEKPSATKKGLRELSIDNVEGLLDDHLIPLIERQYESLEYLSVHSSAKLTRYWSVIGMVGLRRLTRLDLRHLGPAEDLSRLITRCPSLQDVTLYYPVCNEIMNALGQLKQLQRLNIHEGSSAAIEGAMRFAQTCASTLKTINFAHSRFVTDHVLLLLAKIQTLRSVIVGDCPMLTTSGIMKFIDKATHVEYLGIDGLDAVTDQVLFAIGNNLVCLQELDISRCPSTTNQGADQLIRTSKTTPLKRVVAHGCPNINEHNIRLRERELGLSKPLFFMLY